VIHFNLVNNKLWIKGGTSVGKKRFCVEAIEAKLQEAEVLLAKDQTIEEVVQQ
jgi:uncharacterized protein (DUF2252 family)